jgi:hypothetical protein
MLLRSPASAEFGYDILIEDADGRNLSLECVRDLASARERLPLLAKQYPAGTRLLLRNRLTKAILVRTGAS